jgi:hypothetical protein
LPLARANLRPSVLSSSRYQQKAAEGATGQVRPPAQSLFSPRSLHSPPRMCPSGRAPASSVRLKPTAANPARHRRHRNSWRTRFLGSGDVEHYPRGWAVAVRSGRRASTRTDNRNASPADRAARPVRTCSLLSQQSIGGVTHRAMSCRIQRVTNSWVCAQCSDPLPERQGPGRPPRYCSRRCASSAERSRMARRLLLGQMVEQRMRRGQPDE